MATIKKHVGILDSELMKSFPSGTAAATFPDWVANYVSLEQCLGMAGFLDPAFYKVQELILRDRHVAEELAQLRPSTPFGDDPETVERYFNVINLAEFFLMSADEAVERRELVAAFGRVLQHFWGMALRLRFPDRQFEFEITEDLFNEEGLCLTFSQRARMTR